jgi:Holliday junction resolvase RusA-like endonuclease
MFEEPENLLKYVVEKLISPPDFLRSRKVPPPKQKAKTKTKSKNTYPPSQGESWYRDKLAKSLGGQTEVQTVDGRIDILTATEIIEVKTTHNWKHALGQILVYGKHYPYHQKRIHLYGNISEDSLQKAILICRSHNVLVTREK